MWTQRTAYYDKTHDTSQKVKCIILVLLMCMYTGCVVLYISASNTSMQIKEYTRILLLEVAHIKDQEDARLQDILRLTKQQEQRILMQNALIQNLMSQSEVIFYDLEIISQMQKRRRPKTALSNIVTSDDWFRTLVDLRYNTEYARRRAENIVRELWFFVFGQIKDLSMAMEQEKEARYDTVNLFHRLKPCNAQETEVDRLSLSPVLDDSTTFVEVQYLNKSNAREMKQNLSIARSTEQAAEQLTPSTEATRPKASQFTVRNDPNSLVNMIDHKLQMVHQGLTGYRRSLTDAFDMLRNSDYSQHVRKIMPRDLGSLVQRRLDFIQNPKDCRGAQKIVCSKKACGFGCNFHHWIYCLITAYATKKTLLIDMPATYTALFDPPSTTCRMSDTSPTTSFTTTAKEDNTNRSQVTILQASSIDNHAVPQYEMLPIIEELPESLSSHIPLSVPKDLAPKLALFHGNPAAWWVGQIATFLFRPTPVLMSYIKRLQRKLGFKRPIVGVHVRRTDKLAAEAAYHSLEEYMLHVEDYYDQLQRSQPAVIRRVFLATDDPTVLPEAKEKYPNYTFLSDANASKISIDERELENPVKAIATDIYFLSRSDFLVCTFSSQVCRLAYELMQTLHGDASGKFRSLDDIYYFGGQRKHQMVAVESYNADPYWVGTISLQKGDIICVAGNHWNGFSKGFNERTSEEGLYPSYAVEDTLATFPMPEYSNVH